MVEFIKGMEKLWHKFDHQNKEIFVGTSVARVLCIQDIVVSAANMMVVQYLYAKIANCEDVLLQSTLVKLVVASSSTPHCLI